jgi:hypothetical protein
MKHLQNQKNNRQKSNGLRQALNHEVNIPECPRHFRTLAPRDNSLSGGQLQR